MQPNHEPSKHHFQEQALAAHLETLALTLTRPYNNGPLYTLPEMPYPGLPSPYLPDLNVHFTGPPKHSPSRALPDPNTSPIGGNLASCTPERATRRVYDPAQGLTLALTLTLAPGRVYDPAQGDPA